MCVGMREGDSVGAGTWNCKLNALVFISIAHLTLSEFKAFSSMYINYDLHTQTHTHIHTYTPTQFIEIHP
jgi:hypothetical protein